MAITTTRWLLTALLLLTAPLVTAQPAQQGPTLEQVLKPFVAHYKGRANGMSVSNLGQRELLQLEDGRYQLQYRASAMIYTLEEISEFRIADNTIIPLQYRSNRGSFFKRRKASIDFDWDSNTGSYDYKGSTGTFTLQPNTQDPLSGSLELARLLTPNKTKYQYREAEKRGIGSNELVLIDQPELKTAIGTIKTWHLQRLHKDDKRNTEIWLHHDYPAIPVKVHQIDDGDEFQLDITRLEFK